MPGTPYMHKPPCSGPGHTMSGLDTRTGGEQQLWWDSVAATSLLWARSSLLRSARPPVPRPKAPAGPHDQLRAPPDSEGQ